MRSHRSTALLALALIGLGRAVSAADEAPATPKQFVDNVRSGCEAQEKGTNIRARREPVEGTMVVYAVKDCGAIQTGSHRFYGIEAGKPDVLRETGQLFHLWKHESGGWKLARVFSYDHRPAE